MDKNLLLVVSFGSTHDDTCRKNIGAVERQLADAFSGYATARAFTSGIIRKALIKRGTQVDDVPAALQRAKAEGFDKVVLQPTHLLYGEEYEKLCAQTGAFAQDFAFIAIGKPLLADTEDLQAVAGAIATAFPAREDVALVLMGHGTGHYVNPVYAAMQTVFRLSGREDVFVGTVEAWPGIEEVAAQLEQGGYKKAVLTPLMLVAGDHAANDMAGDQRDSWKSVLTRHGFEVETVLRGLGEYPQIRQLYEAHARQAASAGL